MIAFFDTCVHVDLLRGTRLLDDLMARIGGPIRLSPIVAHELLRGARGHALRAVKELVARLQPLEPPSWRRCFLDAASLVRAVFPHHEDVGIGRLQNDALLALTARHTGALFVTCDAQFAAIRRRVPFSLLTLE
jgi:predicted nucleic acid-binding protein